jgi:hypothetical protein
MYVDDTRLGEKHVELAGHTPCVVSMGVYVCMCLFVWMYVGFGLGEKHVELAGHTSCVFCVCVYVCLYVCWFCCRAHPPHVERHMHTHSDTCTRTRTTQLTCNRVDAETDVAATLLEDLDNCSNVVLRLGDSNTVARNDDAALSVGNHVRDLCVCVCMCGCVNVCMNSGNTVARNHDAALSVGNHVRDLCVRACVCVRLFVCMYV